MSELPDDIKVVFNWEPWQKQLMDALLSDEPPIPYQIDSYELRRKQRFEASVMHVMACTVAGVKVNCVFADEDTAKRVFNEANRRLQEFYGE